MPPTTTMKSSIPPLWASYHIRKTMGCACTGNAGNVFPATQLQRKSLVSVPAMHVTLVPWCMSGSLTRGGGENVPDIPGACTTRKFSYLARIPCHTSEVYLCIVPSVTLRGFIWALFTLNKPKTQQQKITPTIPNLPTVLIQHKP